MKVVVITGASAGIGAALARQLGVQGDRLVLAARRKAELEAVAAQSGTAKAVVCDVRQRADVDSLREAALAEFGQIDVWINNAGRGIGRRVMELTDEDIDEMISVNLKSAIYGMQAIIPYFQEHRAGHLINISSFLGRVPMVTFRSIYSASKAALNVLTTNLRMDLKAEYPKINISLVMPGGVATDFPKNALWGTPPLPPGRSPMTRQTADEVAAAIVSLIANPQPEMFTNLALAEVARQYCMDKKAFEERMQG